MPRRSRGEDAWLWGQITHLGSGCWIWRGRLARGLTPIASVGGRTISVRRFLYQREKNAGQPLPGTVRCFASCQERRCVAPAHTRVGPNGNGG